MADPVDLPGGIQSLLQQHSMVGAQRQSDGAEHYAENLRYNYLTTAPTTNSNAERVVNESGSGRARTLDNTGMPSNGGTIKPA